MVKRRKSEDDERIYGVRPSLWTARLLENGAMAHIAESPHCQHMLAKFVGIERDLLGGKGQAYEQNVETVLAALRQRIAASRRVRSVVSRNLGYLHRSLGFDRVEREMIALRVLYRVNEGFEALLNWFVGSAIDPILHERFACLLGTTRECISQALDGGGRLLQSGLMHVERGRRNELSTRVRLVPGLCSALTKPHESAAAMLGSLLPQTRSATLELHDFAHISDEVALLANHLDFALREHRSGVNVLLHGKPGCGKTELAAALARRLGCNLYEGSGINQDDEYPAEPQSRLLQAMQTQRLIRATGSGILLLDECEDLFPLWHRHNESAPSKAVINECLERNPTPTIWISNHGHALDEAFLRRFDLVLHVPPLPARSKRALLQSALPQYALNDRELTAYSEHRDLTPAVLARLARVARSGSTSAISTSNALHLMAAHYLRTLGAPTLPPPSGMPVLTHDLDLLNPDVPLTPVIEGLRRTNSGPLLFHGQPGTGKSALGRAIAQHLDRPLLRYNASDLLSKWVGETEKHLCEMFDAARREGGVLLLDEADSFLRDREHARARWEVSQTNELLTQMEAFEGIFICTTNRLEDLDPAALRRFDIKIGFQPLGTEQRIRLIRQCCACLAIPVECDEEDLLTRVQRLDGLTPGDAAAALRRLRLEGGTPTLDALLAALADECRYKPAARAPIGFLH